MNIVVTGASRGIGYGLVEEFIKSGHNVIAVSRNTTPLTALAKKTSNGKLIVSGIDLEHPKAPDEIAQSVGENFNQLDILINNAGLLINKPFQSLESDDFDRMFNVNVKAPFNIVRTLAHCFAPGAHIVNIGSMGGYQGSAKFPGLSLYSASKGALAILTECLAEEMKPVGVKVNCLALGAAQTEMLGEAFPGYKAPVTAGEMASYIAWFALNGHNFFNGKILPVSVTTP
ncbi:MAG: SDR family oxidoreductase [Bacteroidia bacterium]|nr:SDR family oxidoreductase [Bacteroidia bacterium]